MSTFTYQPIFELGPDETTYRKLPIDGVSTVTLDGQEYLRVEPGVLRELSSQAFDDIAHLLRPSHLAQLRKVVDDTESSANDRFVAMELLRNANIASGRVLPGCQDTGTAIVMAHKGERVLTGSDDAKALSEGVFDAYERRNLRYSQLAPLDMYTEKNTGSNLPAQIEVYAEPGDEYELLFIAKGGGSANKSFLFQETKALLNPTSLLSFVEANLKTIGTSACPPYHLALVIGGTSARVYAQDSQAREHEVSGPPPDDRERAGACVSRPGHGATSARDRRAHRDRRPVRRQVLRPRRQGHPTPASRRLVPGGSRCVLFGRPPSAGQDHARRRVFSSSSRRTRPPICLT